MRIQQDEKGQPFIEWKQPPSGAKRVWIRKPTDPEKDWAGTGRYVNACRIERLGSGPKGNSTDFPIYSDLPDEQILVAFVTAACAITGCPLP